MEWQRVAGHHAPAGFVNLTSASVNVAAAGTSAPRNTWVFAEKNGNSLTEYALEWTGSAWTVFKLSSKNIVLGTAVFGPGNVWEFGQKPGSGANLGYGPAWVLHYDGTAWRPVTVPATPVWVSAPAATDIWALGPSAATVNKPTQVTVAVHWDGSSWHTLALPKLAPVDGQPWAPDGIVAQSARQVWVMATVAVNPGTGTGPPGVTLLHWNGKTWAVVAQDLKHRYSPGLTTDGDGGFWLTSNTLSQPGRPHHPLRQRALQPAAGAHRGRLHQRGGRPDPRPRYHLGLGNGRADPDRRRDDRGRHHQARTLTALADLAVRRGEARAGRFREWQRMSVVRRGTGSGLSLSPASSAAWPGLP